MSYEAPVGLKRHPLSLVFGDMSEEEYGDLVKSIAKIGQKESITIYEGKVLDGWHRYTACDSLAIKAHAQDFPLDQNPVEYVRRRNLYRRSITTAHRAIIQARLLEIEAERATQQPVAVAASAPPQAQPRGRPSIWAGKQREIAAANGMSTKTLQRAAKAVKQGAADAVIAGKKSLAEAAGEKRSVKAPPIPVDAALVSEVEQLRQTVADLTSELEAVVPTGETRDEELIRLRKENATLREQVGVWQEKHAEAVDKIRRLEASIRMAQR